MSYPAPIVTERLVIRIPVVADAERIARFCVANRAHLAPWEPARPEAYFTPEFWREEIARLDRLREEDRGVSFLFLRRGTPHGEAVGRCSITNLVRGPFQAAHLGFAMAADAQGKGLMFEGLAEVVHYAFAELGLHRLMANYRPENVRSARLLERLGFRVEGLAKDYLRIDGEWRDHVLTALVHPGWRET